MDGFFIHYVEANIICIIIFMILLLHDVFGVDRQEKQLKYDRTLIAFMFYFAADCLWAAIVAQKIPVTRFIVVVDSLCIYLGMVFITYTWLDYVMAIEQVENRNRPVNRFAISFPFLISTLILIITYIVNPGFLINEAQEIQDGFSYFLVGVPYIYLFAVMYYTIRKAISEENPVERRKHLLIGLFPLLVIVGGLIEMLFFPYEPIFCYCSTILMLVFFIQMIEKQISVDPLDRKSVV